MGYDIIVTDSEELLAVSEAIEQEDSERNLTDEEWDAIYIMYENGGYVHPSDDIAEGILQTLDALGYVEKANITVSCPEGEWWLTTKGFMAGEHLIA